MVYNISMNSLIKIILIVVVNSVFISQLAANEKVKLQLKWFNSFQFAGYYMAKEKGFYSKAGLDVEIIERDPTKNNIEQVINGEAHYGVADSAILLYRAKGNPVKVVASIFQHSPLVFIAKRDSKIYSPFEMKNRVLSYQKGLDDASLLTLLKNANIKEDDYSYKTLDFSSNDFVNSKVDVMSAYLTNEPFLMQEKGIEINIINPLNYGIDFYGDNLFTTEKEVEDHPQRVEKFKNASLEGWKYALENIDETIEIIKNKYHVSFSIAHLKYSAKITHEMIVPEVIALGYTSKERFYHIAQTYERLAKADKVQLDKAVDTLIYTTQQKDKLRSYLYIAIALLMIVSAISLIFFLVSRRLKRLVDLKVQELQRQNDELKTYLDTTKDGIAIVDLKTNFLFFNDAYLKMTGFTRDELLAKSCAGLSAPEDLPIAIQALEKVINNGYIENFEKTCILNHGNRVKVNMSIALMPDKQRILLATKDITESKKNEKLLQDYVALIDKNIIISSTDLSGSITYISDGFCDISGYTKEELIGKNHRLIKDQDADPKLYKEIWETITNNKVWNGEVKNRRKNGGFYWVKVSISPIFDEDNIKIGYTAIRQDITDKKILEEISITDALTGIYNRRYFDELFEKIVNGAKRDDELINLIIMDIDFFKQYNDTYGHQMGDEVLKKVAYEMKKSLKRADDYCFRVGGEEFAVIFKVNCKEQALELANTIRKNIEDLHIIHDKNLASSYVTVSLGLTSKIASEITNCDEVYKQTDDLLYRAKESGRNKLCSN